MPEYPILAVVGASGAVGREALTILAEHGWPAHRVRALTSKRSAGTALPYGAASVVPSTLERDSFVGVAVALFMADADVARAQAPRAVDAGALVIDNSSAFRLAAEVPLVVPEVNGHLVRAEPRPRLIANPNCSTILLVTALEPVRRAFGLRRIVVATYQAVSGAGLAALEELDEQTRGDLAGREPRPRVFPEPCAFNVFSHESPIDPGCGHNVEERKIVAEARRIWDAPELRIAPTCVRVPVRRAHSQAITVELETAATAAELRETLAAGAGLTLLDEPATGRFPTPRRAAGRDEVLVGRIRPTLDAEFDDRGRTRSFALFACADQLRKGAAGNAWQIATTAGVGPAER